MARSEEALIKRAAKRLVPLEEQKVKDSRRKKRTAAPIENTESKRAKVVPVKAIKAVKEVKAVQISEKDDWICGKCSNKNFHHRETCNRCQGSREIKKDATPKPTDVISPKPLALKVVSETSSSTATKLKHSAKAEPGTSSSIPSKAKDLTTTTSPVDSDSNWTCQSCKNENFAARSVCNRCQSSRPSSLGDNAKKESAVPKMIIKNPAAKNSAGLKCWGKQASDSEIAANMALRKAYSTEEGKATLTPEELIKAEMLIQRTLRARARKDARFKQKKKRLTEKSAANKLAKTAKVLKRAQRELEEKSKTEEG